MINYRHTTTYVLEFQLSFADDYKWTKCGKCINTKTDRMIRKVINGGSIGYWIKGDFYSVNTLRKSLEKIKTINLPF